MLYVTFRFDDGTFNQYSQAFKYMQQFRMVASIYIIGDNIGANGYINHTQLDKMQQYGWEIGYHSLSHDREWIHDISRYDIETNPYLLKKIGIRPKTFALPHSVYNDTVIQHLNTIYKGIVGIPSQKPNPLQDKPKIFRCYTITKNVTFNDIRNLIDNNDEVYIIFLFHRIETSDNIWSCPEKLFYDMVNYFNDSPKIRVLTVEQALNELY